MGELTNKEKYDLNNMNVAAQNIQLGTYIDSLTGIHSLYSGSYIAVFGNEDGYTAFDSNGAMTISGSAMVWNDLVVPLTTAKLGAINKPTFDETNVGYLFPQNDPTAKLFLIVQMPHSWKEGSYVFPHVHFVQASAGSPVFKMDYKWTNMGEIVSGSFTTITLNSRVYPYTSGSMHQLDTTQNGIDGTGKKISSILQIKLYRDDNTYTGDVLTLQFDIHYLSDSIGSLNIGTK